MPLGGMQRKSLEAELAKEMIRLRQGVNHCAPLPVGGDPREQIPRIAEENCPSVTILGTHGGGRFERGVVGSVAEGILRSTSGPSVTVGPEVPTLDSATFSFQRILFATDLDPGVAAAGIYAVMFAKTFRSKIDILHVIHAEDVEHPGCFNEISKEFYAALDKIVPEHQYWAV